MKEKKSTKNLLVKPLKETPADLQSRFVPSQRGCMVPSLSVLCQAGGCDSTLQLLSGSRRAMVHQRFQLSTLEKRSPANPAGMVLARFSQNTFVALV